MQGLVLIFTLVAGAPSAVEAKPLLTESDADRVGAAAQAALAVSDEDEESESDNVDAALDIKRTLLNVGLFVSHIAGWKGIWDFQDTWHGEGMPWYASVGIGVVVYLMRFKVDDFFFFFLGFGAYKRRKWTLGEKSPGIVGTFVFRNIWLQSSSGGGKSAIFVRCSVSELLNRQNWPF